MKPRSGNNGKDTGKQQIAGAAIDAGVSALATGIGAAFQSSAIKNAQKEERAMYDRERDSNIAQYRVSNSLRRKSISQEERSMKLQHKKQEYDLRINRWLNKIKTSIENQQQVIENSDKMFNALNDENVRSAIMKSFV